MTEVKENRDRQIDELNEDLEGFKEKIEIFEKEKKETEEKIQKILDEKNEINNKLKYKDEKIELIQAKVNLELKLKKSEDILFNQ